MPKRGIIAVCLRDPSHGPRIRPVLAAAIVTPMAYMDIPSGFGRLCVRPRNGPLRPRLKKAQPPGHATLSGPCPFDLPTAPGGGYNYPAVLVAIPPMPFFRSKMCRDIKSSGAACYRHHPYGAGYAFPWSLRTDVAGTDTVRVDRLPRQPVPRSIRHFDPRAVLPTTSLSGPIL